MVIKANHITLSDLLGRGNESGDFLRNQRMFITSAEAWGALFKDLISALGIERAKRFLLRYGYKCGIHEAKMLKDMFQWENKKEWILAGVTMHNLAGRSSSTPTKMIIDPETGEFDVEGYWHNSYEAIQYLQYFPVHFEPVCYFLEGYASGYCSTSLGKRVVFKEVECIGKGDKHCRFVGKTLEKWGNDISMDLVDYAQEDIGNELDQAHKRIEKQREILNRGNAISNQLTQNVLQGDGLATIAKTLGDSLQCGIVISNQHFETITTYGRIHNFSLTEIISSLETLCTSDQTAMDKLITERATIQLHIKEEPSLSYYPLITPIVVQNTIYGYISIIKNSAEKDQLENSLIERSANICALHLLNEKTVVETEHRLKGELLDEILFQNNDNPNIRKRLALLGYNLDDPHIVFIFRFQNKNQDFENDDSFTNEKNLVFNMLKKHSSNTEQEILVSNQFGQIQALVPENLIKSLSLTPIEYGSELLKHVRQHIPSSQLTIGVSNLCPDISSLHRGFKQAEKALDIAQSTGQNKRVISFSELGHISILLDARNPEELENYAKDILGHIYENDRQKATELLKTLYFYLNNECNLHKTARYMSLSIGGMRYRLASIKERFNIDMNNSNTRREVQLALDIYLAFGKFSLNS